MSTINSFEDIKAWQLSRLLIKEIYVVTKREQFFLDRSFRDQIRRAVTSVSFNIAEGFERSGTKEFLQFLGFAKGSIGEVSAQLYTALDLGYVNEIEFRKLRNQAYEISKALSGLMTYLAKCDYGKKYVRNDKI